VGVGEFSPSLSPSLVHSLTLLLCPQLSSSPLRSAPPPQSQCQRTIEGTRGRAGTATETEAEAEAETEIEIETEIETETETEAEAEAGGLGLGLAPGPAAPLPPPPLPPPPASSQAVMAASPWQWCPSPMERSLAPLRRATACARC
jgi:hypothetical protein